MEKIDFLRRNLKNNEFLIQILKTQFLFRNVYKNWLYPSEIEIMNWFCKLTSKLLIFYFEFINNLWQIFFFEDIFFFELKIFLRNLKKKICNKLFSNWSCDVEYILTLMNPILPRYRYTTRKCRSRGFINSPPALWLGSVWASWVIIIADEIVWNF